MKESCPECGSFIVHQGGCINCPVCGWSACRDNEKVFEQREWGK